MRTVKHPKAVAIVRKGEGANTDTQWSLGDYLVQVSGGPSPEGFHTAGQASAITEVAEDLAELDTEQDYPSHYLSRLRSVANAFPKSRRRLLVSWTVHHEAGTPEILTAVLAAAKAQDVSVTKRFARSVYLGLDADHRIKRKVLANKTKKAADTASAKGDHEKAARLQKRANKLRGAPQRDPSKRIAPKPEDVPMMIVKSKFSSDATTIRAMISAMDKEISPHLNDLSKVFVVASVEQLLEVAEMIRKLAAKLNRNQSNKRAHLHAVA